MFDRGTIRTSLNLSVVQLNIVLDGYPQYFSRIGKSKIQFVSPAKSTGKAEEKTTKFVQGDPMLKNVAVPTTPSESFMKDVTKHEGVPDLLHKRFLRVQQLMENNGIFERRTSQPD